MAAAERPAHDWKRRWGTLATPPQPRGREGEKGGGGVGRPSFELDQLATTYTNK